MGRWLVKTLALLAIACGGNSGRTAEPTSDTVALAPRPEDAEVQREAYAEFGRELYGYLRTDHLTAVLLDDLSLRRILEDATATQIAALRNTLRSRIGQADFRLFAATEFQGVCVQGIRDEPAHGAVGLREDGWMFDRILLIASRDDGGRVAGWVEGVFVYTTGGFRAIDLLRVEAPRWEHSDLQIATCDVEVRVGPPQPVVEVTR